LMKTEAAVQDFEPDLVVVIHCAGINGNNTPVKAGWLL